MSDGSSSFHLLDERIQRFIWMQQWEALKDIQESAIPLILDADRDVIIVAATASGKTEAAFLPAITRLLNSDAPGLIVYASPLKALINDQFERLERLCDHLEIPVWPWHGDISQSSKTRFMKHPNGVLLITPESLEAFLCNRGTSVASTFARSIFFVIDELHAFIGAERGRQLQSILHRIERAVGRRIPRIGLSATIGDLQRAALFLRPDDADSVEIVQSNAHGSDVKILIKGYEVPRHPGAHRESDRDEFDDEGAEEDDPDDPDGIPFRQISEHLFRSIRGTNNLVFPNSRGEVERFTHLLSRLCESNRVPNEFWPHHGNLSKEIRSQTEAALKAGNGIPATAICTNTLELGIDIGAVKSVAQIGPPSSVASLRQRLGRSGRRKGEPAMLRGYVVEDFPGEDASLTDELRLSTVQMAAMVSLLLEHWYEPPAIGGLHLSTLVQQILSLIAQYGGASIGFLHDHLCSPAAPFSGLRKDEFARLIRHLGERELLMQDSSGELLHGRVGEKFVNHYTFYAAFATDEEYRIVAGCKTLGTLPVSQMLVTGQRILFAGRTWRVLEVDEAKKTICVAPAPGGAPPLFSGGFGRTHSAVRQRMRDLLEGVADPVGLDGTALRFLHEGRAAYERLGLGKRIVLKSGDRLLLLTWLGDGANEGIACLLTGRGYPAFASGPVVEVGKKGATAGDLLGLLSDIARRGEPTIDELLENAHNLEREKWDWALPPDLLRRNYASLYLDMPEAMGWIRRISDRE